MLVLLSLLGVPLWLLLGWLGGALWHRHQIKEELPDHFKAKVRVVSGSYRHVDEDYPMMAGLGLWAHDILLLEQSLLLARNLHLPVAEGVQPAQPADPERVKGLGDTPVTLQFRLDNGAIIELAAPAELSAQAQGPFFSDTTEPVQ